MTRWPNKPVRYNRDMPTHWIAKPLTLVRAYTIMLNMARANAGVILRVRLTDRPRRG